MPEYLIFHIKRFAESKDGFKKNKKAFAYPLHIDMDKFCAKAAWTNAGGMYELMGVILHKGHSLEGGHYICFSKR